MIASAGPILQALLPQQDGAGSPAPSCSPSEGEEAERRGTTHAILPRDATEAAALIRRAFAAQPVATDPPSSALRETAESVARQIEAGGGAAVVRDGDLAAVLLWAERDGGLYCGRLAVAPEARGRGLARILVAAAEREAEVRGLPRLWVKVRLPLEDNRRFFAACGFRETGREAHPGYAEPTTVLMEKAVPR